MEDALLEALELHASRTRRLAAELWKILLEPMRGRAQQRYRVRGDHLDQVLDADLASELVDRIAGLCVPMPRTLVSRPDRQIDELVGELAPGWAPTLGDACTRAVPIADGAPLDGWATAQHLSRASRLLDDLRQNLAPVITSKKKRAQLEAHLDSVAVLVNEHWPAAETFAAVHKPGSPARGLWSRHVVAVASELFAKQRQRDALRGQAARKPRPGKPPRKPRPDVPADRELAELLARVLEHLCPDEPALDRESAARAIRRDRRRPA